jgi:hypothetical protein
MTPTQRDGDDEWHADLVAEVRDPNTTLRAMLDLWTHGHCRDGEEYLVLARERIQDGDAPVLAASRRGRGRRGVDA